MEILIDNKNGNVWDATPISGELTWSTTRTGSPASVEFDITNTGIYQASSFTVGNGDIVRVTHDGVNVFYGYVFSVKKNQDEEISIKAYDQVRYLLNNDTYVFSNQTASQIVQRIAKDFNLKVGRLDANSYAIPKMVEDNQTLLDIIEKALTLTLVSTQNHYVFFDDFGALSLRKVDDFLVDFFIGDGSLMTGYDYNTDIDTDTYNRIKLYRDNKESGKRDVFIAQDSNNIAKWGTLQLYQTVDENMNAAQINQMLNQLIQLRNRETKTLKIDAIGNIKVRAGCYVPIIIDSLGINQPMLVDEAKHSFDGTHTMSLTLKVI